MIESLDFDKMVILFCDHSYLGNWNSQVDDLRELSFCFEVVKNKAVSPIRML